MDERKQWRKRAHHFSNSLFTSLLCLAACVYNFLFLYSHFLKHFCLDQKTQWREGKLPELSVSAAPRFPLCNLQSDVRWVWKSVFAGAECINILLMQINCVHMNETQIECFIWTRLKAVLLSLSAPVILCVSVSVWTVPLPLFPSLPSSEGTAVKSLAVKLSCLSKSKPVFHYLFICRTPEISNRITQVASARWAWGGKRSCTGKQMNDKDGKSDSDVNCRLSVNGCHFTEPSR